MKKFIFLIVSLVYAFNLAVADKSIDKQIVEIGDDKKNYISAECRASSENEAYSLALQQLKEKLTDYFIEQGTKDAKVDDYLNKIGKLTSEISSTRYRVLLYIPKIDLKNGIQKSLISNRDNETDSKPVVVNLSTVENKKIEEPERIRTQVQLNPTVKEIQSLNNGKIVLDKLVEMKKVGKIKNAAAYPIQDINNFYIVVISPSDEVVAILNQNNGEWYNTDTGSPVNIQNYKDNTAYWITFP